MPHQRKCWILYYNKEEYEVARQSVHAFAPLDAQMEFARAHAKLNPKIFYFAIGTETGRGKYSLQMLTEITPCQ